MKSIRFSILLLFLGATSAFAQTTRPNVLFIMADDLCNDLGCYGVAVKSPNIDKLASTGVKFDRAYCQYPLCGPSRCSLLSGLRPDTIGVVQNGLPVRHKLKDVVTLPQLFKNNGYFSAPVGKIYHLGIPGQVGQPGPDDPPSWNYTFNPKGNEFPSKDDGDEINPDPKDGQSFRYNMLSGDGRDQHDYQAADEAIRLLNEHKAGPFFLAVGFIRPHVPEVAPKTFFDLYPIEQVKLPEVPANDRDDIPALAFSMPAIDRGMTPQQCRESIRAYHATTSFMDAQVGRVLDELDRLKLREKTIVVFLGDHGYSLGQHHAWQKMLLFDRVCRVPMIVATPGGKPLVTRSLVESLDLFPTLADLAGLTPPKELQGQSLKALLTDPSRQVDVHDAVYTQVQRGKRGEGRSVRTDRWRYTQWTGEQGGGEELYDERNDPEEFTNLAKDPQHGDTLAEMKKRLSALQTKGSREAGTSRLNESR